MAKKKDEEKVTVQANEKLQAKSYKPLRTTDGKEMKRGRVYHDPDREANPKPIGKDPITVVRTTFVNQRLKSGDLVEVRGGKAEEGKE